MATSRQYLLHKASAIRRFRLIAASSARNRPAKFARDKQVGFAATISHSALSWKYRKRRFALRVRERAHAALILDEPAEPTAGASLTPNPFRSGRTAMCKTASILAFLVRNGQKPDAGDVKLQVRRPVPALIPASSRP